MEVVRRVRRRRLESESAGELRALAGDLPIATTFSRVVG